MPDFDWVKARAACSLSRIFERLFAGVQSDVDSRNAMSQDARDEILFESSREGNRILVTRSGPQVRLVKFHLTQNHVAVDGDNGTFHAMPGLNNPGDCTLMVDGVELELWQVRRKALESLFFDDLPRTASVTIARRR